MNAQVAESSIDVVFDGPPGAQSGRFVEVENPAGSSIRCGEWIDRGNGLWALRIPRAQAINPAETVMLAIAAERERQIAAEGFAPRHDDEHADCELAVAAAAYVRHYFERQWVIDGGQQGLERYRLDPVPSHWPWEDRYWKPKDARSDLIRAAALLIAEVERLDRVGAQS